MTLRKLLSLLRARYGKQIFNSSGATPRTVVRFRLGWGPSAHVRHYRSRLASFERREGEAGEIDMF
jgi:hypothetical protein